jgi:hypothetical protein
MACFVFRNEQGEITKVNAPNGKESKLFSNINSLVKDKEQALKLWAQVYTPSFKSWFGQWDKLEEAKTHIKEITGLYKDFVNENTLEESLFEAAVQTNSSVSEGAMALKIFGPSLIQIAMELFPNAKVGDKFQSTISKVVDENGEPLVVYHGTGVDFNIFDKSKSGLNTKHPSSSLGFFFSTKEVASIFVPKIQGEEWYEFINAPNARFVSAFLNIKDPSIVSAKEFQKNARNVDNIPKGSDGIKIQGDESRADIMGADEWIHDNWIAFNSNQIKSVFNKGDFATDSDNIYYSKNKTSPIGSLQAQGKLGKRVGPSTFEVKLDPANSNLVDQQQRAYDIQQQINKKAGKEVAEVVTVNGNPAIKVDPNLKDIIGNLDPDDVKIYKQFITDNLYTSKDTPVTTELVNNAAKLAKDLGRPDLVDVARIVNKYLVKNPTLTALILDELPEDVPQGVKAYFNRTTNRVVFSRSTMGTGTLENEASTVLHELLHGLTFQPWFKQRNNIPLNQEEKDFMHIVDTYFNYFRSRQGADLSLHEFSTPEEFLMGSLMDKYFQDHLSDIGAAQAVNSPFLQFFKDLLRGFLKLFGVKIEDGVISKIDPNSVSSSLLDSMSDYLSKMSKTALSNSLKEEGRNYGLSFAVTAENDYNVESKKLREEKAKIKATLGDGLKEQFKKSIEKSILSIKSFGSSLRNKIPESQEGFKAIFNQLKKLEDPNYNLDYVDYFFDFTSEIQAMMNVANDKISRLLEDETINDVDFKIKEYEDIVSAARNFDPILDEIQSIKIQLENLGFKEVLKDLNELAIKRARIESVYSMGVFPLVTDKFVDILSPSSKKAVERANDVINQLDKRIALAEKNNNKSRVAQLQKDKVAEQNKIDNEFILNSDKVQSWLRGQMGDSNILNVWNMAGISNSNPIVSGLAKFIRDNVGQIAPQVLDLMNNMQSNLESYSKQTARSLNDISKFNSPMIQIHKVITGRNEKGEYTTEDKLSLLHEFNNGHIQELQKFKRDLTELYSKKREIENSPNMDSDKLKEVTDKITETRDKQKQFINDYMEQKYAPEVHKALDMLYEDLGGYNIWDYMGPLISRIDDVETAIEQEEDPGRLNDLYKQLDDYNLEMSRLGALYEKSPDSRELKVAEKLKERRELLKKYSTFILTDKGKIQFETQFARMKRKVERGEITPERYERWLEDNTVTQLTQAYWDKKRDILKRLDEAMTAMGHVSKKNETIAELYRDVEEIAQPHRDSNGIIDGTEMTTKELKDAKIVEEKIEEAKDNIANVFGLTKLERMELANLDTQINELNHAIGYESDPTKAANLEAYKETLEERARYISAKKKSIPKNLVEQYFKIIKELSELDESRVTKYYLDESENRREQEVAKVDVSKMPGKFVASGRTYNKQGDVWLEIGGGGIQQRDLEFVQNVWRQLEGNANYLSSDWYRDNHITKKKFERNENYSGQPDESTGDWTTITEPTYSWKQTRPRDAAYILENQPSLKYKKREIKDEYVNKNYQEDINGDLRPKVKGAKDNRFINQDYFKLINSSKPEDQATAKMLKFLTDTYFKSQQSIPKGMRPGYELPSLRRTDTERLTGQTLKQSSQDFFEYLGQIGRSLKDKVATNEQDKDILFGYNDDFNGIVPIKFIGDISSKDISIDLPKSILTFASEMLKREQLIKALPFANAVKDIVNNPSYRPVKTNKEGLIQSVKKKFLPKNTEVAIRSQTSNTALQINEMIKSEIYGEQMKDQPAAKLVNTTLGLGAKVMLGFNFISSVQNYANAFTQSIIDTESKYGNFTGKDYFKAQKIYYGNIDKLMSDIGKYGNKSYINQFFDYFGGINFKIFSKNHKNLAYSKVGELAASLSIPNQITEHMLNYHMGIAIALHHRVADSKGNMVPIFDAFTLHDGKLVQKEGFNITEKDRQEMISKMNSSSRRINGEYGDKILLDKYVLGKLVTFMNRYLIPFVVKRYGARKPDIQDGIRDEGYWRLFGRLFIKDIKTKALPIIGGWKYYTDEEREGVVKALTEVGFTIMFALAIAALGGDDNKKIKDNSILENNLLYALKGMQQQNEAFMPIPGIGFDDMLRKVQNPFPILGKVKNLVSLMNDGTHTIWYEMGLPGVDEHDVKYMRNSGWHKPGDFKMFADFQKLVGIKKFENYLYPAEALKAQESISRIK